MNSSVQLFDRATELGLRLERRGNMLAVIPKGKCPPDFASVLRQHKRELLDLLETKPVAPRTDETPFLSRPPCPGWQSVPPNQLPLNLATPRPTPRDRQRVIAYVSRQASDRPSQLTAWLVTRENVYYDGPGSKWDCGLICYAAARDAACWQLNRSERDVLELLSGFDECSRK